MWLVQVSVVGNLLSRRLSNSLHVQWQHRTRMLRYQTGVVLQLNRWVRTRAASVLSCYPRLRRALAPRLKLLSLSLSVVTLLIALLATSVVLTHCLEECQVKNHVMPVSELLRHRRHVKIALSSRAVPPTYLQHNGTMDRFLSVGQYASTN